MKKIKKNQHKTNQTQNFPWSGVSSVKLVFFSGGKPFRDRETRSFTKYAKKTELFRT